MSVSLVFGMEVDDTTGTVVEGAPDNNLDVIGKAGGVMSVASPSAVVIGRFILRFANRLETEGVLLGWYESLRHFFFDGESSSS